MALLTIRLLGVPLIVHDGAPVVVDTRKATALLAYLALTGRVHAREGVGCATLARIRRRARSPRLCAGLCPRSVQR